MPSLFSRLCAGRPPRCCCQYPWPHRSFLTGRCTVVPYPPGGTADVLARLLGQRLSERLGTPVVVDNRAGAGTAIGSKYVAQAAPDGYTLLLGTVSSHAMNPALTPVGYDPVQDFTPITRVASVPFVVLVNPALPVKTMGELVALAKARRGRSPMPRPAPAPPTTGGRAAGEIGRHPAAARALQGQRAGAGRPAGRRSA